MSNVQKFDSSMLDRGVLAFVSVREVSNSDGTLVFLKYTIQEILPLRICTEHLD